MTRRRKPTDLTPVWAICNCPHCEMPRGSRCRAPRGNELAGSHKARIDRAHLLRRPTKQLDLFEAPKKAPKRRKR